jgi:Neocarzinostatin family
MLTRKMALLVCGFTAVAGTAALASPAAAASAADVVVPVSVTPAVGLPSEASVEVSAGGFVPGEAAYVFQCAAVTDTDEPASCDWGGLRAITASATGEVNTPLTVRRSFSDGGTAVDCVTVAGGCVVVVINEVGDTQGRTPIVFTPAG